MAKNNRNRKPRGSGTSKCMRMPTCDLVHKGTGSCANKKCSKFMGPKDPKAKKM